MENIKMQTTVQNINKNYKKKMINKYYKLYKQFILNNQQMCDGLYKCSLCEVWCFYEKEIILDGELIYVCADCCIMYTKFTLYENNIHDSSVIGICIFCENSDEDVEKRKFCTIHCEQLIVCVKCYTIYKKLTES